MNSLVDFGSHLSRTANCSILGDCSGKTISRRAGLGLRKGLQLDVSPKISTDIAHLGMLGAFLLMRSKRPQSKTIGKILAGGLVLSYLNVN